MNSEKKLKSTGWVLLLCSFFISGLFCTQSYAFNKETNICGEAIFIGNQPGANYAASTNISDKIQNREQNVTKTHIKDNYQKFEAGKPLSNKGVLDYNHTPRFFNIMNAAQSYFIQIFEKISSFWVKAPLLATADQHSDLSVSRAVASASCPANVALSGTATQVSSLSNASCPSSNCSASLAIDGNTQMSSLMTTLVLQMTVVWQE